jgi:hypothetical protein
MVNSEEVSLKIIGILKLFELIEVLINQEMILVDM